MKLELKENMYYRTYSGSINKITSIKDYNEREYLLNGFYINKDTIKKVSYNIIDILKVGDYVNGCKVIKNTLKDGGNIVIVQGGNCFTNEEIKLVITHEQMEQMTYKVGE
mgnify:CR=1 FL=1